MNSPRCCAPGAAIRIVIAALAVGLMAVSSGGCGQRGPLYLPEPMPAADDGGATQNAAEESDADGAEETENGSGKEGSR